MLILVPLLQAPPCHGRQTGIHNFQECPPSPAQALRPLAALQECGAQVLVASPHSAALQEAERLGFSAIPLPRVTDQSLPIPGLAQAAKAALWSGFSEDRPALALGSAEIPAPRDLLGEVRQALEAAPQDLHVSCRPARDNPCQFLVHYNLLDVFPLYPLEPPQPDATWHIPGARVSTPFPMDWTTRLHPLPPTPGQNPGQNPAQAPTIIRRRVPAERISYAPGPLAENDLAWLYESPRQARLVIPEPLLPGIPGIHAVSPAQDRGRLHRVLSRHGRAQWRLHSPEESPLPAPLLFRFSLLRPEHGEERVVDVPLSDPYGPFSLPPDADQVPAMILGLLQPLEEGDYDIVASGPAAPGLWSGSPGCIRNEQTGRPVNGRQDAPLVLEPDGVAVAGPLGRLRDASNLLRTGKARHFTLRSVPDLMSEAEQAVRRMIRHAENQGGAAW